jgi:phosphomannomutase
MGLLVVEMVACYGVSLHELVNSLLKEVGPAYYERVDLRLRHPVAKDVMTRKLVEEAPAGIGGEGIEEVITTDGVKYVLADDSWLLIRPSGTEPVLRVYAEGRTPEMVQALMEFGGKVAESVS